jgi:glycosyltransferase involved in cell wall biosynthesis
LVRQENSGSVGFVRNVCMTLARGEYFAFLDQDDWWLPEKIARQVAAMQASSSVGLVHTEVGHYYETLGRFGPPLNSELQRQEMAGQCFEQLLMANAICNSSVLVRRRAIDQVGMCDLQVPGNTVQDYDLWLRVAAEFELAFVGDELTVYCVHPMQGLWDRRKMLAAELDLLLRVRDEAWWRSDAARRRRMASLYDSLAVAHIERSDYVLARRYLRLALRMEPTLRANARYMLSLLPAWLVGTLRAVKCRFGNKTSQSPSFCR